jgi:circadian clock protein KaiC
VYPERTTRFFSCLANELRREGVTVMMTLETVDVVSSAISTPFGISGFVDNLMFLRFSENGGHIHRLLTITKMRDSDHDPGVHLLEISKGGVRMGALYSLDGDIIPRSRLMGS